MSSFLSHTHSLSHLVRTLNSSLPPTPDSPPANTPKQNQSKGSPEIRVNGKINTTFDEESDTDYSDMEDDNKQQELSTGSSKEDQFVNSGRVLESDVVLELDAVMETMSASSLTVGNGNSSPPNLQLRSNHPRDKTPPVKYPGIPTVSSTNTTPEMSSLNSQTYSSKVHNGSPVLASRSTKVSGSGAVAQHIKHLLSNGTMPAGNKTDPKSGSLSGNSLTNGHALPRVGPCDNQSTNKMDSITSNTTTASVCARENDVFSSFDYTSTDQDSSFDFASPPVSPLKTSSITSRLLPPTNELSQSLNSMLPGSKQKMRVKFSDNSKSRDIFDSTPTDSAYTMRSRTNTLAALNGYSREKRMERGRKKLKELQKDGSGTKLHRQSSLTDLTRAKKDFNLDLLSPELQSWYRAKVIRALENKYGGTLQANKSAMVIQREYRNFTLNKIFKEIREGKNRVRAQSMRDRRPSVLHKNKPAAFRREYSTSATYNPQVKAREASQLLNRERTSHSHSGSRLDLVHKKRTQEQERIVETVEVMLETPLESDVVSDSVYRFNEVKYVCFQL